MLDSSFIGHALFELFLFALLCLLSIYLFKEYISPQFARYLSTLAEEKRRLKNREADLVHQKEEAAQALFNQRRKLLILDEKLKLWHAALLKKEHKNAEENKALIQKLEGKKMLQKQQLHMEKTRQEVIPQATKNAHESLNALFANKDGEELLAHLIDRLEQKVTKS